MKYEPQDADWINPQLRKKAAEALNDGDVMEVGRLLAASMRANREERLEVDSLGMTDFDKPEGFK